MEAGSVEVVELSFAMRVGLQVPPFLLEPRDRRDTWINGDSRALSYVSTRTIEKVNPLQLLEESLTAGDC